MEPWEDPEADPNGIGPVCRHCHRLIDWHPYDHADGCPEYVADRPKQTWVPRFNAPDITVPWRAPYLARVILYLAEVSDDRIFPECVQDAIDWAHEYDDDTQC